ncbi:MAG: 50S ribosomal protein L11 methyltransferase, partial [Vicinamibacterales bacterium]
MGTSAALIIRFPIEDPTLCDLVAAEIDGTDAVAIHNTDNLEWRVFYHTYEARDAAREALRLFAHAHGLTIGSIEVEDEDWARRSQSQLTPVRVGDIVVSPPWDRARRRRGARRSRAAER